MGMYDTFFGKIKCECCSKEKEFEEQTKDYECMLAHFELGDYIDKGNVSYYYELKDRCFCGHVNKVFIAIVRGQIVGIFTESEEKNIKLCELPNIEDGLAKRLRYDKYCELGCGYESRISHEFRSIGDSIIMLNDSWIIDSVSQENIDLNCIGSEMLLAFYKFSHRDTYVYHVHNRSNTRQRILVTRQGIGAILYLGFMDDLDLDTQKNEDSHQKYYKVSSGYELVKVE